jgi:hypothetical protein
MRSSPLITLAVCAAERVVIAGMPKLPSAMHLDIVFTFADRDVVTLYRRSWTQGRGRGDHDRGSRARPRPWRGTLHDLPADP